MRVGGDSGLPATFRKDTPVQAEIDCQQSHQDDEHHGENTNYHDLYCIQKCSEMLRVISPLRLVEYSAYSAYLYGNTFPSSSS